MTNIIEEKWGARFNFVWKILIVVWLLALSDRITDETRVVLDHSNRIDEAQIIALYKATGRMVELHPNEDCESFGASIDPEHGGCIMPPPAEP